MNSSENPFSKMREPLELERRRTVAPSLINLRAVLVDLSSKRERMGGTASGLRRSVC